MTVGRARWADRWRNTRGAVGIISEDWFVYSEYMTERGELHYCKEAGEQCASVNESEGSDKRLTIRRKYVWYRQRRKADAERRRQRGSRVLATESMCGDSELIRYETIVEVDQGRRVLCKETGRKCGRSRSEDVERPRETQSPDRPRRQITCRPFATARDARAATWRRTARMAWPGRDRRRLD